MPGRGPRLSAPGAAVLQCFGMKQVSALVLLLFTQVGAQAQQPAPAGPVFAAANQLMKPADYREWMFVTSGLGMTYNTPATANAAPNFTNVYVNPSSYRSFMNSGRWPDGTMFVLEIRASASEGSINKGGNFQTGVVAIEAAVKDSARYPATTWAYFNFGRGADMKDRVEALPVTANCYACHSTNTAVDNTFVQFYPTLFEVAARMGTLKPGFASH
jgi:Cytochrome P460